MPEAFALSDEEHAGFTLGAGAVCQQPRPNADDRADRRKRNEQSKSFFHKSSSKIGGVEREAIAGDRNQVEPLRGGLYRPRRSD
jgi:hypothetical protein